MGEASEATFEATHLVGKWPKVTALEASTRYSMSSPSQGRLTQPASGRSLAVLPVLFVGEVLTNGEYKEYRNNAQSFNYRAANPHAAKAAPCVPHPGQAAGWRQGQGPGRGE